MLPVIKKAHELGLWVITCDYLPDNFAHKYSDQYENLSIVDKDAVLDFAKKEVIDGIMSFACDPGVVTAAYVAEKLGLPSVGPYESVCILQNKGKFRKFLSENGFNVPVSKSFTDKAVAFKDANIFNWPVIVKPADAAGSKGVSKVKDIEELSKSIDNAMEYSLSGEFIIEDFLEVDGYSSDTDCFSVNGKLVLTSFNCQLFDSRAPNPYTPAMFMWPSIIQQKNQSVLNNEIQRLISLFNLGTGIYNVETRQCKDGKPYIMEFSPRGGGNRLAECLEFASGVNLIENSVRAAVGYKLNPIKQLNYNDFWVEVILHSNKSGLFEKLWISEKIESNVFEKDLWVKEGDKINSYNSASDAIGALILQFTKKEELNEFIENYDLFINVMVE